MTDQPAARHRVKSVAGLLAFLAGFLGAHRLYLGLAGWWLYPLVSLPLFAIALPGDPWYRQPAFFIGMVPVIAGFIEALVICLTPDEKWDAKFNAMSATKSNSRWGPVLVAVATLMVGATVLMTIIALMAQTWFESLAAGGGH